MKLEQELQLVVPTVREYHNKYVNKAADLKKAQDSRMGNGIVFVTNTVSKNHTEHEYLGLLKSLEMMTSNETIQHQTKCLNELHEIISKSACSICSGRSDDFFSSDGRLPISEPTCRAVLKSCNSAWTDMVKIAEAVREITQYIRSLTGLDKLDAELSCPEELGFTMNLDSFITNRNLIPIMKNCGSQVADCSFEHVAGVFDFQQNPPYLALAALDISRGLNMDELLT